MSALITTKQLSKMLVLGRTTLYTYRKQGMPHVMLSSRTVRYDLAEVENWLNQARVTKQEGWTG